LLCARFFEQQQRLHAEMLHLLLRARQLFQQRLCLLLRSRFFEQQQRLLLAGQLLQQRLLSCEQLLQWLVLGFNRSERGRSTFS